MLTMPAADFYSIVCYQLTTAGYRSKHFVGKLKINSTLCYLFNRLSWVTHLYTQHTTNRSKKNNNVTDINDRYKMMVVMSNNRTRVWCKRRCRWIYNNNKNYSRRSNKQITSFVWDKWNSSRSNITTNSQTPLTNNNKCPPR